MNAPLCRALSPAAAVMVTDALEQVAQQALAAAEIDTHNDSEAAAVSCDVADALAGVLDLLANSNGAGESMTPHKSNHRVCRGRGSEDDGTGQGENGTKRTASRTPQMTSRDCPQFDRCSAPLCPLDPGLSHCRHLNGERVCLLLREWVKPEGRALLRGAVPREVLEAVEIALPIIMASSSDVRRRLREASGRGSKRASMTRVRIQSEGA